MLADGRGTGDDHDVGRRLHHGPGRPPGQGLGERGEQIHAWVFVGRWKYGDTELGAPEPDDAAWIEQSEAGLGAAVGGRRTYEAAEHWGDKNPWGKPFFIVTHRPAEEPPGGEFKFVDGVANAIALAREAAGDKEVRVMGGADVIRQALAEDLVDR